jgi:hypothetical protein
MNGLAAARQFPQKNIDFANGIGREREMAIESALVDQGFNSRGTVG